MANKRLRSTDGNDADDGSTWALANATMDGLIADMAAGDDGFVSQSHAESDAGTTAMSLTFPGTIASPNRVIFCNDSADPPTSLASTGSLTRTGTSISATLIFAGCFTMIGGTYSVSTSSASAFKFGNTDTDVQIYDSATFIVTNANAAVRMQIGAAVSTARNSVTFDACTFKFANAAQGFSIQRGTFEFNGGGLDAAGSAITSLFPTALASGATDVKIKNFDVSYADSSFNILGAAFGCSGNIVLDRCKLPTSWTGGLFSSDPTVSNLRISMYNCDSADTNYKILVGDRQGTLRDETTLVITGGASETWKVTTSANANEALTPFYSDFMLQRITSVGTAKTLTFEILHDSLTDLTDADVYPEVEFLGTNGTPLGVKVSGKRPVLSGSTPLAASTAAWTTTGLTNPRKQKVTIEITPQEIGNVLARLVFGKPSYTAWMNPEFSIT